MSLGNQILMFQERKVACFFVNMPSFITKDQRVWICLECARVNNAREVIRHWAGRWGNLPAPSEQLRKRFNFQTFLREGTCHKRACIVRVNVGHCCINI